MAVNRGAAFVTRDEFKTFARSVEARFDRTDDAIRGLGVVLERIDSKVTTLAEGQEAVRAELKADIRALEARLSERIERLEAVVRQHSADIQRFSTAVDRLSREVEELRKRFDRRDGTLEDHERRIAELEKRAGITR
jgi:DNA repair exonuclease SbcCD ATPase subunit